MHGLKGERDGNCAFARDAGCGRTGGFHLQVAANRLLDHRHVHGDIGSTFTLCRHDDLSGLQDRRHHVQLVVEQLLERPAGDVRPDAARGDELLEREHVDRVFHHVGVLERDGSRALEAQVEAELATAKRRDERPEDAQADGRVDLARRLTLDVDAGLRVAPYDRRGHVAGDHEIRHGAEPRQILSIAMQQLQRLGGRAGKTKDAVPVVPEERNRRIRSGHDDLSADSHGLSNRAFLPSSCGI